MFMDLQLQKFSVLLSIVLIIPSAVFACLWMTHRDYSDYKIFFWASMLIVTSAIMGALQIELFGIRTLVTNILIHWSYALLVYGLIKDKSDIRIIRLVLNTAIIMSIISILQHAITQHNYTSRSVVISCSIITFSIIIATLPHLRLERGISGLLIIVLALINIFANSARLIAALDSEMFVFFDGMFYVVSVCLSIGFCICIVLNIAEKMDANVSATILKQKDIIEKMRNKDQKFRDEYLHIAHELKFKLERIRIDMMTVDAKFNQEEIFEIERKLDDLIRMVHQGNKDDRI